ncbi:MAG: 3-methyl-2-oxobutanoate hydroxymethyltransferase [Acidimicrobiia bacterium]|nr:3-methyl-2-oxobutanoate hydroxymethyltransferase [Acidimicrobiia bacterium]MYF25805.1 3-methyl-2-oxobutanoate hydroxymethyltransferase [Acidimicrobiia bacterium]
MAAAASAASAPGRSGAGSRSKITIPIVQGRKGGPKLTMVTAYDFPGARLAEAAEVDLILVGDSVANVVLGYETTTRVTLDDMIHHTKAVARAKPQALLVVDMPWMTFHVSPEDTLKNAARLIREGGAEAVKLEGGANRVEMVRRLVSAEIPVMGHIGLTPQSVLSAGGYQIQGRKLEEAQAMIKDAQALEEAGVFALVLEGVPAILGQIITQKVQIPTIGIGAGPDTDGQVLVMHDLLGLNFGHYPRFVRRYAEFADQGVAALRLWIEDVRRGSFPGAEESYQMIDAAALELLERSSGDHSDRSLAAQGSVLP